MSIKVHNVLWISFLDTSSANDYTCVCPTNNGIGPCYPTIKMGVFVRQSIMSTNLIPSPDLLSFEKSCHNLFSNLVLLKRHDFNLDSYSTIGREIHEKLITTTNSIANR